MVPETGHLPEQARTAQRYRYSVDKGEARSAAAPAGEGAAALQWPRIMIGSAAALAALLALYPSELQQLVQRWISDSGWSHGLVVPFIAAFFVWIKWDTVSQLVPRGSLAGLGILLVGVTGQVLFRSTGLPHMSALSILVVLFGAVLFIFGWEYMKLLWLPIAYLVFAVPPPTPLYVAMTTPMQRIAAWLGEQFLPLFGYTAFQHGTVIDVMNGTQMIPLNIAQACSGMRMLMAFFALAVALGYSTQRPVWQKILLAGCALPIAIFCNGARVTLTGIMAMNFGLQWAEGSAHEYTGLLMLGPAMLMQLGAGWILDRIFVETPDHPAGDAGGTP